MRRSIALALGLLTIPAAAAAQVEIGMDGGLTIESVDDAENNGTTFSIPSPAVRLGIGAGETMIVESRFSLQHTSQGDASVTALALLPGVNFLLGEQYYVRGEAGLAYISADTGVANNSSTQYALGAAAGLRVPLLDNVHFRSELGVDRWFENTDEGMPASWDFRILAGISATVN